MKHGMKHGMNYRRIKQTFGALALVGVAMPALGDDQSPWYIGGSAGQSRAEIAEGDITRDLLSSGFTTTRFSETDREYGWKAFGGYRFNPNISVELGYFDLGRFDYTATTTPEGTLDGKLDFAGYNLDVLGMFPVTEQLSLFSRIGVHHSRAEARFIGSGAVNVLDAGANETATNFKVGFGAHYDITPNVALRVEAERFTMDDAVGNDGDLDLVSAGLVFTFPGRATTPVRTPEPVAQAAAPAPPAEPRRPAPAPAPAPRTEQYCALLEIQFGIGADDTQRADLEALEVLVRFLERYPDTDAVIEGHTDDVGSAESNMALSIRRAESVVDYLVNEKRISRSRLKAVGFGETRPIADNSTQEGMRANRRIGTKVDCAMDVAGLATPEARPTIATIIGFEKDSTTLQPRFHDELGRVAEFLKAENNVKLALEGHTDGDDPENAERISRERAEAVADHLVEAFGIDRSRLRVEGFGATRRLSYDLSPEARQQNRRVNVILLYPN